MTLHFLYCKMDQALHDPLYSAEVGPVRWTCCVPAWESLFEWWEQQSDTSDFHVKEIRFISCFTGFVLQLDLK